jgi:hypothetical protein
MKLVGYSMSDEMMACVSFLAWQGFGKAPEVVLDTVTSLAAGRGASSVALVEDDETVAVGFWAIVEYWRRNRLVATGCGNLYGPGPYPCAWRIESRSDPRWNTPAENGAAERGDPSDMAACAARLGRELGAPPDDLKCTLLKERG